VIAHKPDDPDQIEEPLLDRPMALPGACGYWNSIRKLVNRRAAHSGVPESGADERATCSHLRRNVRAGRFGNGCVGSPLVACTVSPAGVAASSRASLAGVSVSGTGTLIITQRIASSSYRKVIGSNTMVDFEARLLAFVEDYNRRHAHP
jgi:hypothetical protein